VIVYRAAWVVPIAGPPLRDGWVAAENGRIVALGASGNPPLPPAVASEVELGQAAIMPGLVNAHTHLELTHLRGRIPAASAFVSWIRELLATRRRHPDPEAVEIVEAIRQGIDEALRCGTALVGDISNSLVTLEPLASSRLAALVFYELIGFSAADPVGVVTGAAERLNARKSGQHVRVSMAAHAPYSVSPQLFQAIRQAVEHDRLGACSVHLAESAEETEFIRTSGGPWRELLEELGAWNASWAAPGVSPVRYLDDIGFLGPRTLVVHGVRATCDDLEILGSRRATLVTCPRSNAYTGAGKPPIEAFYRSDVRLAVGTDSLASTPDLNVFAELAEMRALAPSVPARVLLDSGTRQGARALGFDEYGTIEPGRSARLIAVDIPPGTFDVEEYLVSGIAPEQVRWVES
jgi:cytosine/adenosine deaminase-related metal-dependent hydrolase